MFEIFKIIWDLFVAREAVRKGQLTWRRGLISGALVLLGYLILVPATALYDKHPEYKPLFVVALILTAIDFIFLFGLALYWWRKSVNAQY